MIEITKENINEGVLEDKHWDNPKKFEIKSKISKHSKILIWLFGTVTIFTIINAILIYSFYKILMKL